MRYSIEPRKRGYVKGYEFLSFAKNIGRNLSNKCDTVNKSANDSLKIASKRAIQKTAEASGDLVDNFIADKITSISKQPANEPHSNAASNKIPKERYISTRKTKHY